MTITHPQTDVPAPPGPEAVQRFAGHVLGTVAGAATTAMMVLGDSLGLYRAMSDGRPVTAAELAGATGCSERYVREWLHQQCAAGLIDGEPGRGVFSLPPEKAAVLAVESSPAFMLGGATLAAGWFRRTDRVAATFRGGRGLPWDEQDEAVHVGTDRFFGPGYRANLVDVWLPLLPGIEQRLRAGGAVADVGCGRGLTSLLMAGAFPDAQVTGFDTHAGSIEVARQRATDEGVPNARFEVADAGSFEGSYDLVCLFDTLHDLGDPLGAARHARESLRPGGALLAVEPAAAPTPAQNMSSPAAPISYTASVFQCLPASLAQPGAAGLGAQAGPGVTIDLLRSAGFDQVRVIAENPVNAVYSAQVGVAE